MTESRSFVAWDQRITVQEGIGQRNYKGFGETGWWWICSLQWWLHKCVYIYIYIHIYMWVCVYSKYIFIYINIYLYTSIYIYIYIYICTHTHIHTHIYIANFSTLLAWMESRLAIGCTGIAENLPFSQFVSREPIFTLGLSQRWERKHLG